MRSAGRTSGGGAFLFVLLCGVPADASSSLASRPSAFVNSFARRSAPPPATPAIHRHRAPRQRRHVDVSVFSTVGQQRTAISAAPEALGTSGDWSAYLDETKGLIYYFNPTTGESKWEAPADADFSGVQTKIGAAKKAEMRERLKVYLEERLVDSTESIASVRKVRREAERKQAEKKNNKNPTDGDSVPDVVAEWREWRALVDEKRGRIYYHSKSTRESRWDRPEGFPDFRLSASRRVAMEAQGKRYSEWHDGAPAEASVPRGGTAAASGSDSNRATEPAAADAKRAETANSEVASDSNFDKGSEPFFAAEARPSSLPIVQQGDWSAYFDVKTGVVFYLDENTGDTSWDPPFENFPRIVMEGTAPKVLDPGSGNISMERALGYIGVDEMAAALAWEEAKERERARKAAMRAAKAGAGTAKSSAGAVEMYETAKNAELERLEQEKKSADEERARKEAAAKLAREEESRLERERLEKERIAADLAAAKERETAENEERAKKEAAAKLAREEETRLERERSEKERIAADLAAAKERETAEKERIAAERAAAEERKAGAKQAAAERAAAMEREATAKKAAAEQAVAKEQEAALAAAKKREAAAKRAAAEQAAAEQKVAAAKRAAEERAAAKEREAAAKLAIQQKLEQERLEKERAEKQKRMSKDTPKRPVLPEEDPAITAENVRTMVAPLKTRTLYEVLRCPATASRTELKRSYLSLAKETHPDALLQIGAVADEETERRFVEISRAWKTLGDPTSRRRYDRELQAKGISSKAGRAFEGWVAGAARAMDEALARAESDLEGGKKTP